MWAQRAEDDSTPPPPLLWAFPHCARKMLEGCQLECQKLLKNCRKSEKLLPKFQKLSPIFRESY